MPNKTTPTQKDNSLKNAEKIIHRFGGIRPMATKMGEIPVTTVQGWKKRDVIPANRRNEVLKAARMHKIDLSDLVVDYTAANPETGQEASQENGQDIESDVSIKAGKAGKTDKTENGGKSATTYGTAHAHTDHRKTNTSQNSRWIFAFLVIVVVFLVAGLMTIAPKVKTVTEQADRITQLEKKIETVESPEKQSYADFVKIPEIQALSARVSSLQNQAQEAANQALNSLENSSIEDRIGELETRIQSALESKGTVSLGSLWGRLQLLDGSNQGQEKLDESTQVLLSWITRLKNEEVTIEEALPLIREENQLIAETFEGVVDEDLKAGAMLLAMSQLRGTLARDQESFETDLALLQKLIGSENPALNASIEKLSPHAREGVLSPGGLSREFRGLAGDVVSASLQGEDVSLTDRARARFSEVLSVEKDGELLNGTDTQITVALAQKKLDEGNIQDAIELLQELDGGAREKATPFIKEAELTLLSAQVQELLAQNISSKLKAKLPSGLPESLKGINNPLNGIKSGNVSLQDVEMLVDDLKKAMPLGGEVVEDPESGFKIYKKTPTLPTQ